MTAAEVFANAELEEAIQATTQGVYESIAGKACTVGIAAMFSVFVAVCEQAQVDAGAEFEHYLAYYEQRKKATHRGSQGINWRISKMLHFLIAVYLRADPSFVSKHAFEFKSVAACNHFAAENSDKEFIVKCEHETPYPQGTGPLPVPPDNRW